MRARERRIRRHPSSQTASPLSEMDGAGELAPAVGPTLPLSREVESGARGDYFSHISILPPGSPSPYTPDTPIQLQTHAQIHPVTPHWDPRTQPPVQRSEPGGDLGQRIGAGDVEGPPLEVQQAAQLPGHSPAMVIQRKVNLGPTFLSTELSMRDKLNRSTLYKVNKMYVKYRATKNNADKELRLAIDMVSRIDSWLGKHASETTTKTGRKLAHLRDELKKDELVNNVGLAEKFIRGLSHDDLNNLWGAHTSLWSGDVPAADVYLTKLRASIGDAVNLVKSFLIRRTLGSVSKDLSTIIQDPTYTFKDEQGNLGDVNKRILDQADIFYQDVITPDNLVPKIKQDQFKDIRKTALNTRDKSNDPVMKNLSDEEITAIVAYSSGIFAVFNDPLRQKVGTPGFDSTQLALTQLTVSALNKFPSYAGTSYRHTGLFGGYRELTRPGATVVDMAFLSTASKVISCANAGKNHDVLEIVEGKSGRQIAGASIFGSGETEVLFKPGTRFRVLSVYRRDKQVANAMAAAAWTPQLPEDVHATLNADNKRDVLQMIVVKREV